VVSSDLDAVAQTVTFTVQNTGTKTITAWDVRMFVGDATSGYGTDAYRSFAGLAKDTGRHIAPAAVFTATARPSRSRRPSIASQDVTAFIEPVAAVFADKSSVGDQKQVDFIFQVRAKRLAGWQAAIIKLEHARNSTRLIWSFYDTRMKRPWIRNTKLTWYRRVEVQATFSVQGRSEREDRQARRVRRMWTPRHLTSSLDG
jgi:hypothetical protein